MELEVAKSVLAREAAKETQLKEAAKVVAETEGSVKDPDGSSDDEPIVE